MSDVIPVTYATIELRTERLPDLHMALKAHGFELKSIPDPKRERLVIEDSVAGEAAV